MTPSSQNFRAENRERAHFHFSKEDTKTQRDSIMYSKSHSCSAVGCEPNPELRSQSPYFLGPPPRPHLSPLGFLCKSPESMRDQDGPLVDHLSSVWQTLPIRTPKG